ncbi:MAG: ABC transporter substrate-binding protein [Bacillota bacterium]
MTNRKWPLVLVAVLLLVSLVSSCSPGEPLPTFKFLSGDSETAKKYAQGIQENLRANLGIETVLEATDFNTRLEKMRNGDFDIVLAGWGADYDDPMTFLDLWVTDGPYNDVKWSNKTFDELIAKAKASGNQDERMAAMAEAEGILLTESPIVPLYWPAWNYAEHPWVKGILRATVGPDYDWKWAYTEGRPGGDGKLAMNLGEEPPDLQSITTTDQISFEVLNAVNEGLTRKNPQGLFEQGSGVAESWTISPDGLVYTFTLKDNAKWSDGSPITAHDFEYAWKKVVDPRTASQYNYMFFFIKGAEEVASIELPDPDADKAGYDAAVAKINEALDAMGVDAKDDKTLEVTLVAPSTFFIGLTAFPSYFPVKQSYHEAKGDAYALEADAILYNGPFMISEWNHGSNMTLKKNPTYWDAASVKLEEIKFDMIKDINTPVTMYEANELDAIGVPGEFIPKFRTERPNELKQMAQATCWYLELNPKNPAFANPKLRRAISLGFDRQSFVDNVMKNFSMPAIAYNPPSIHGKDGVVFIDKYVDAAAKLSATANLTEARKLLEEACKEMKFAVPKPPAAK